MKFKTQSPLHVLLFSLILIFQFSCSKDSDLLTDYVLADAKQDLVIGKFVVDDTFEVAVDNTTVLDVLANDTFENEEEVLITETSSPSNGTVEINTDNTITYTPETTEAVVDTFTYTTEVVNPDETVSTETGNVTVNVADNSTLQDKDLGELLAFPGAVGHGRFTSGGRGKSVYQVTNLNNSGPGSFRDAVSKGDRTIVFRVGGVINITERIYFGGDNITIAGQTAPGDGIAIYGSMTDSNNHENIIIRYVNFLVGDAGVQSDDDSFRLRNTGSGAKSNFIFDHCGFFWGKDEVFAIEANSSETGSVEKVSVQKCIIGESFNRKGMIIWRKGFDISFIDNLFSNNQQRNIRSSTRSASWEQINCVVYNYSTGVSASYGNEFDIIGCYFKNGNSRPIGEVYYEPVPESNSPLGIQSDTKAYLSDNTYEGGSISTNVNGTVSKGSRQVSSGYTPIANIGSAVLDNVLNDVGANLNGNNTVAQSQISDVTNDTGSWISSESGAVALSLSGGTAYTDSDSDGIDDSWEIENGLNPNDPDDGKADANGDGYTNLESFLHYLTVK